MTDDPFYRRELSDIEKTILEYIKEHPGINAEDIANIFHNKTEAYMAIAYLCQNLYVYQDLSTQAIYPEKP